MTSITNVSINIPIPSSIPTDGKWYDRHNLTGNWVVGNTLEMVGCVLLKGDVSLVLKLFFLWLYLT